MHFYDDGSDALETPYFQDSISSGGKEGAWGGGLTIWGLAHVSFYLHMRESPPESMLPASPFLACWGLCTNFFDLTHASFSCSVVVSHIGPCQPPLLLKHFLLYEPGHVCSLND